MVYTISMIYYIQRPDTVLRTIHTVRMHTRWIISFTYTGWPPYSVTIANLCTVLGPKTLKGRLDLNCYEMLNHVHNFLFAIVNIILQQNWFLFLQNPIFLLCSFISLTILRHFFRSGFCINRHFLMKQIKVWS